MDASRRFVIGALVFAVLAAVLGVRGGIATRAEWPRARPAPEKKVEPQPVASPAAQGEQQSNQTAPLYAPFLPWGFAPPPGPPPPPARP